MPNDLAPQCLWDDQVTPYRQAGPDWIVHGAWAGSRRTGTLPIPVPRAAEHLSLAILNQARTKARVPPMPVSIASRVRMSRSQPYILSEWPTDFAKPGGTHLQLWLNRAVEHGLILREGTGRTRDPFRYWLAANKAKWRAEPRCTIFRSSRTLSTSGSLAHHKVQWRAKATTPASGCWRCPANEEDCAGEGRGRCNDLKLSAPRSCWQRPA
jgi:hypothetical protein